jgi:hypothetical protein
MTPSGNFFVLGADCGYGKIHLPGDDSGIYLAVNTIAKPSQDPATLEANFINPDNWTWSDGSTGRLVPGLALLSSSGSHMYLEAWMVPAAYPGETWKIFYTSFYSGNEGLGFASTSGACAPGFSCNHVPLVVRVH